MHGATQEGFDAVITPATQRSFQLPMTLVLADPDHFASEEGHVGLTLFPGDGDVSSPDVSWSCISFNAFRERLARAEGFSLPEMWGFGGNRPWSDISTTLEPLLDHPDAGGDDLSTAHCAAMLPRLQAITGEWLEKPDEPLLQQHIQDAQRLMVVLRFCVDESVALIFL
ncbi:hypothetical protein ACFYY1_29550 [Streptomyces sp. NPDC001890]|uniref:hypothetical protein n=1 Tax=Streptomyces sp. NPDC001890 TaxID=3364620 RepID=UPI0036998CD8